MICTNCGSQNPDSATACSVCGTSFVNPYQASMVRAGAPTGPQSTGPQPNVPTNLVWAILATLFCCLPLGIVSIVYAAQVSGKLAAGDYAGAVAASNSAKTWAWVSFGLGLVAIAINVAMVLSQNR